MKIFLDATVLQQPATGIAKSTLLLYSECLRQDTSLHVTAMHRQELHCVLTSNLESVRRGRYFTESAWRRLFLPAFVAVRKPEMVHFPWNGNVPYGLSNTNVVTTLHDVLPLAIPGYFKSMTDEQAYRKRMQADIDRTDVLLTVSEYSKNEIVKNFHVKSEPVVIPHGPTIACNQAKASLNVLKRGDYFLYVGGYDPRKGLDTLIKTFIRLHGEQGITCKLVLCGSKNYFSSEFKQLVIEGVQRGIVEEKGYISEDELVKLMVNAIALVYPSHYEGFGLPPLEAMALGCPVITTRGTAIPEVCGNAAFYINSDDENSLADGIVTVLNNKGLRDCLRGEGFKQAAKFTWESAAHKFLNSLSQLTVVGSR